MSNSLFHTLNISQQDMLNRLLDLDTISNNLANVNTTGFKGTRANFQELLNAHYLEGNTLINSQISMNQGTLQTTGNSLDWAIQGNGFFQVQKQDGTTAYTRDGQFILDANRQLVNANGCRLIWNGQIPEGVLDVNVDQNGAVYALSADGNRTQIGTVQLARFANPTGLRNGGDNLWLESDASGQAQIGTPGAGGYGVISSGAVERSNVNMADEMTHMMSVERAFQMSTRVFQQTDTMISEAIHMRKV